MTSTDTPTDPAPTREIRALYAAGRYHDAHAHGERTLGALREWPARVLAGRIAARLGGGRLAQALFFSAHRRDPSDGEAATYYAGLLFARRGPWHALRWLAAARPSLASVPADLDALAATALAHLRDFDRAHALIAELIARHPRDAWLEVQRATVLELHDRTGEALDALDTALALAPGHRAALGQRAHLLAQLGRAEEAHAELSQAVHAAQSFELLSQRAELAFMLGRYESCEDDLAAARDAALLAGPLLTRSLAARQAEAAYLRRAYRRAAPLALEAGPLAPQGFAEALATLEDGSAPPRVELTSVPHIRQHHQTCAPASLAAIAAYHGDPVDHLELADTICYAGTPAHRSRAWAEERGFAVRELDVTLDAARALLDAGLPFMLSTVATASAHAQVVIGYDLARRSLLVRDPSVPELVELAIDPLLERQAFCGPRGFVMAPPARAAALRAIELPGAHLYDLQYALDLALDAHDVAAAERAIEAIHAAAPGSRHLWTAKLALATYAQRGEERLRCLDALLALHPEASSWLLWRGDAMHGYASREDRLAFWEQHAHRNDPALLEALAEELRMDPPRQDDAARLLRRALRLAPQSGMAHHVLADLGASRGDDPEAVLQSYRFGACLAENNEHFARTYFDHARLLGRDDEALALLEQRAERAASRATEPARTLFEVHADRGNPERGLEILERLAEARPDDGDLRLVLLHACLDCGEIAAAEGWLARASALPAREADRALAEARLARARGQLIDAGASLERARAIAPDRMDVLSQLATLRGELDGDGAALALLDDARAAAPESPAVLTMLCARLSGKDDARAIALLDEHLARHPEHAWARRERALARLRLGDVEGALEAARATVEHLPHDSFARSILAHVLERRGDAEAARDALRRAVELDVDNADAIALLGRLPADPEQLREDARFVLDRLEERVSRGEGLIEGAYLAGVLAHDERRARLERLLDRAPNRPDAWEAVIRARADAGELDEADETARTALRRFPRWFSLRLLRAQVLRARGLFDAAETLLRELVARAPGWAAPLTLLVRLLRERGALDEAVEVVEDALRSVPRSIPLRLERARLLFARGERDDAFVASLALARDAFADDAAYESLYAFARSLGREDEVEALVREEIAKNDATPLAHMRLGRLLSSDRAEERIAAFRAALERAPRDPVASDLLAVALATAGRHDEAIAVCEADGSRAPTVLRGRRAWIIAERGQREEAVNAMLAVLADDPGYAWGRRNLCDWLDALERLDEFLEHAEQLVREAPQVALHHVYLGDARLRKGATEAAREAFERVIELAPDQSYAAGRVCELALAKGDVEAASRALERVRHSLPEGDVEALVVQIEAHRGRFEESLAALERLSAQPASEPSLHAALAALVPGPRAGEALEIVEDALCAPDPAAGEALAWAWSTANKASGKAGARRLLSCAGALAAPGQLALSFWIEALVTEKRWMRLAWTWLWNRRWLHRSTPTWGAIGFALLAAGWPRWCARWLRDWSSREGVRPWMLLNLVESLWIIGAGCGAGTVVQRALSLPSDHASARHRLWGAFHRALEGETSSVIDEVGAASGDLGSEAGLVPLVRALAAAGALGDEASAGERMRAASPHLHEATGHARRSREMRAAFEATVAALLRRYNPIVRAWLRATAVPSYR